MKQTCKSIQVAAVQMSCIVGDAHANFATAMSLIEQAVKKGAKLVLLPELMPGGYRLTAEIWDTAESFDGQTVAWLRRTSKSFGIYLGTSFLEAEGNDFYNTFVLTTPQGEIAGRTRKNPPVSIEAYFFRGGNESHIIETELGRIGIGICGENLYYERIKEFFDASVDIILMPSSAATPMATFPMRQKDSENFNTMLGTAPKHYAQSLGVPVVFANKCGLLDTPLPGPFPAQKTSFAGLSAIVDLDGVVKYQMGNEQGVIVADVQLDGSRRNQNSPKRYGKCWALPVPWYAFIWPLSQRMGEKYYARNKVR